MSRNDTDKKHDKDKAMMDLIPFYAIDKLAEVLTYGAKKYAAHSWMTVPEAIPRYEAALLRHLSAYKQGERCDSESGLDHLAHMLCNAVFLLCLNNPIDSVNLGETSPCNTSQDAEEARAIIKENARIKLFQAIKHKQYMVVMSELKSEFVRVEVQLTFVYSYTIILFPVQARKLETDLYTLHSAPYSVYTLDELREINLLTQDEFMVIVYNALNDEKWRLSDV